MQNKPRVVTLGNDLLPVGRWGNDQITTVDIVWTPIPILVSLLPCSPLCLSQHMLQHTSEAQLHSHCPGHTPHLPSYFLQLLTRFFIHFEVIHEEEVCHGEGPEPAPESSTFAEFIQ